MAGTVASISACNDCSDIVELFVPQGLYLKPIARVNVCVQLPQLKEPGKSISNWEVMEKVRYMAKPDHFVILKVMKSTLEFIRFEGELENKNLVKTIISRLDGKTIKLSGFPDVLKVRAAEAKFVYPSRHDWDCYFRDAKYMNEMKHGERPDTIHIKDLPSKWFSNRKDKDRDKPSEYIVRKVFETFGEVRDIDIPSLDPYRKEMNTGTIQTFTFGQDLTFDTFIQFSEYIGFVKAMNAFKGMKLLFKSEDDKAFAGSLKVDFDKTKHMTDKAIKKREVERERLRQLEKEREDRVRKEREEEEQKKEEERIRKEEEEREREVRRQEKHVKKQERQQERMAKRRAKRVEKKRKEEERQMQRKIALEERKILIAQRKLETIRLLSELFNRIKVIKQKEEVHAREEELERERERLFVLEKDKEREEERKKIELEKKKKERLEKTEKLLREKILTKLKNVEEKKAEKMRETLRKKLQGTNKLKSAIIIQKR